MAKRYWSVISCLFLLQCWSINGWGQNISQTIKGQVIDAESRQPLVGASVVVASVQPLLGAQTDVNGFFKITGVTVGRHTLKVSFLGYENGLIQELVVGAGK